MGGIAEIGATVLSLSQARLEIVSQNVANAHTPGFRGVNAFQSVLGSRTPAVSNVFGSENALSQADTFRTMDAGKLQTSEHTLDIALITAGFFGVMDREQGSMVYTRDGRFELNAEGFVLDMKGRYLQNVDGQDVRANSTNQETQ